MSEQPEEEPGDAVEEVTRDIATLALSTPGSALRPLIYFPGERHPRSPSAGLLFSPRLLGPIELELPPTPAGGETHLIGIWNETGQLCNVHWPDPDIHFIASISEFPDTRYYVVWIVPNAADTTCYSGLHFGRGKSAYQGLLAANLGRFEGLAECGTCSRDRESLSKKLIVIKCLSVSALVFLDGSETQVCLSTS